MSFVNGVTTIDAAWLNDVDQAAFSSVPQAIIDISNVQARILSVQAPGWADDTRFSAGVDWNKITGLPNSLNGYGITDGGTLVNVRKFTTADSGSAYVPTPGTAKVIVEVQAGGGAGGTFASGAILGYKVTGGGAAGSYASAIFTSNVSGTIMTIGAGGVSDGISNGGGSNAAGKLSSFGTFISCPGGRQGSHVNFGTLNDLQFAFYRETYSNLPSGVLQIARRGDGGIGTVGSVTVGHCGGGGGDSKFGRGGRCGFNGTGTNNGEAATGFGGGGGGGASSVNFSGVVVGGPGAPGVIIIWEFA